MAHVHPSFPPAPVPHQPSPLAFGFAFPRGSPLHQPSLQPAHPPSSPTTTFGSPLRRSSSAFGAGQQQQPFAPQPIGFGFGGSPSSAAAAAAGPSSPAGGRPAFHRQATHTPPPPLPTQTVNHRRRARSSSSDEDDDEQGNVEDDEDRRRQRGQRPARGIKKLRRDPFAPVVAGESARPSASSVAAAAGRGATEAAAAGAENETTNEPDLGVLLALLPPTSLLPLLTNLLAAHPALRPTLLASLPQPSLALALDALRAAEARVRAAVPFGWDAARAATGGGGGVSEHYVVGRVTESVNELVALIQSHLPIFLPSPSPSTTSSSSSSAGPSAARARPPPHPTDQFAYLSSATSLLLRLLSSLPPLTGGQTAVLWARLAREWVRWVGAVGAWVNREGGMVGAGVADGWARELDALVGGAGDGGAKRAEAGAGVREEERKVRREMAHVRDSWVAECGWLVGRRVATHQLQQQQQQHVDVGMEEDEEL